MELVRVAGVDVSVRIVLADIKVVQTALVRVVLQGFTAHITGVTTALSVLVEISLVMVTMPARVLNANLVKVVMVVVSRALILYVLLTLLVRVAKAVATLITALVIKIAMDVILPAMEVATADAMGHIPVSLM